jgi:hypothetical protein
MLNALGEEVTMPSCYWRQRAPRRIIHILILLTRFFVAGTCVGNTNTDRYTILGQGNQSCGKWIADRRQDNLAAHTEEAWLLGYLTAYNEWSNDPNDPNANVTKETDADGVFAWMDNFCQSHPVDTIATGSTSLIGYFISRQIQTLLNRVQH